jgi:hypothetical protein
MPRNGVCVLLEIGPATQNGLKARRAMTSMNDDASTDGVNRRRVRCIQSAQTVSIGREAIYQQYKKR